MRIQGRTLRPETLAERRVLKALGLDSLRVPRRVNPFGLARTIKRAAAGGDEMRELRRAFAARLPVAPPSEPKLPDSSSTANGERAP